MSATRPVQIVWFKRDLRIADHAPLAAAADAGPVLPIYLVEPSLWRQEDSSMRHWRFIKETLVELRLVLAALGAPLFVREGEAVAIFEELRQTLPIGGLWSHEETGNGWSYARDLEIKAWCAAHAIPWHEFVQSGVVRRLRTRDGWARRWDRLMRAPRSPVPRRLEAALRDADPGRIPDDPVTLRGEPARLAQKGGRAAGLATLESFLEVRGRPYRRAMSSPIGGETHGSRLSPYLAFGALSMREVLQASEARLAGLGGADLDPADRKAWKGSLSSFVARLHWHCHFMQKLEDEPAIEWRNFHKSYDGLRGHDPVLLAAWQEGRTGWPFVDACMRYLTASGWINFRMRAMLMAVASFHLWQDWRPSGLHLARLFTDYEPGIHWPQCQMQSGTTGINTIRIYNPVKQGYDQDPDGHFIRRWVPEIAKLEGNLLHEPWNARPIDLAAAGIAPGSTYPLPVRDHLEAAKEARKLVWRARHGTAFREEADRIQDRHGSRKSGIAPVTRPRRERRKARSDGPEGGGSADHQVSLDF